MLERLPSGSRIAVIRLRSLGDCVLTTPALALLKAYRPDLQLSVVVEDRFRAVFEGNPDIAEILPPKASAIFGWRPRLALNLHGGTRSMALTASSGAGIRAGFAHHRYSFIYTHQIPRAQEILGEERKVHTVEHIASAMFWLGAPRVLIPRARLMAGAPPRISSGYAALHPFASNPDKTWPPEKFTSLARHLQEAGLEPVFLAGPGEDAGPFHGFRVWRNAPLSEVKNLIAGAQIFIGNDSGPAHIAAAVGIPSVVLFGSSDPITWAPWQTEARVLTSPGCIAEIEVGHVLAAAQSLKVTA
ncbi:MAG TPA: glycosyltransferase family 9 protein [Bryobacteraceae bacterium]|nr:glycosyltransferase family 9 protein [Bryobacteraceae bacterium]